MGIEHRLQKMKGKNFLYKTEYYKIIDFQLTEDQIFISTDKKMLKLQLSEKVLEDFLPVEQDKDKNYTKSIVVFEGDERLTSMKQSVSDVIEKIKTDASYIPQAKMILQSVQTFTNMVKVEVDIARLIQK